MGGMLADPVKSYPRLFGPNSSFGGENGVQWLEKYPYALPMLANFCFLCTCAALVGYGLEEVRILVLVSDMKVTDKQSSYRPCLLARVNLVWVPWL